eukprot:6663547-Alexandrium_andersonii.AAC.1
MTRSSLATAAACGARACSLGSLAVAACNSLRRLAASQSCLKRSCSISFSSILMRFSASDVAAALPASTAAFRSASCSDAAVAFRRAASSSSAFR